MICRVIVRRIERSVQVVERSKQGVERSRDISRLRSKSQVIFKFGNLPPPIHKGITQLAQRTFTILMIVLQVFHFSSCYSLKGISIPPAIETFYIDQFQNRVSNAPADIGQRFSDEFRILVNDGTRLNYNEDDPDIEFTGSVSSFRVQSVAPERSNDDGQVQFGSTLNRLSISVQVEYINNEDEEDNWNQSFSFFEDFDNDQNLEDIQDQLIDNIFDQILQEIYTRAFTNW